jgi:hypothetical protein
LNDIGQGTTIDIQKGSVILGNVIKDAVSFLVGSLSACDIERCVIGSAATFVATDNHTIYNCVIVDGKTVDLTYISAGYSANGYTYDNLASNWKVTAADHISVNPNGSNEIDVVQFPWAGDIYVNDYSIALDRISNLPADHSITIHLALSPGSGSLEIRDTGNMLFPSMPQLLAPANLEIDDYITVVQAESDYTKAKIKSYAIY